MMSDYESLRAEAREYEAEDRCGRINARRARQAMQGEPGDPPEYIGEDDDEDEEAGDEDTTEAGLDVGRKHQAQAVRPERRAVKERAEVEPWKSLSLTD